MEKRGCGQAERRKKVKKYLPSFPKGAKEDRANEKRGDSRRRGRGERGRTVKKGKKEKAIYALRMNRTAGCLGLLPSVR